MNPKYVVIAIKQRNGLCKRKTNKERNKHQKMQLLSRHQEQHLEIQVFETGDELSRTNLSE